MRSFHCLKECFPRQFLGKSAGLNKNGPLQIFTGVLNLLYRCIITACGELLMSFRLTEMNLIGCELIFCMKCRQSVAHKEKESYNKIRISLQLRRMFFVYGTGVWAPDG